MESGRKSEDILKNILILSSEFSKRPGAPSPEPPPNIQEVHAEHLLLQNRTYSFKQPLLRLSATVPIPVPRTPVKAETQQPDRLGHCPIVTLSITHVPGPMFIPTPTLPRKPLRQSVIGKSNLSVICNNPAGTAQGREGIQGKKKKSGSWSSRRGSGVSESD